MILNSFTARGWHYVPDDFLSDLIADVVLGVRKSFENAANDEKGFVFGKSKFRFYLKQIVNFKVVDFIRKNKNLSKEVSFENLENIDFEAENTLDEKESEDYMYSLIYNAYDNIRASLDPVQALSFEKVVFQRQKPSVVADELGITSKQVSDYKYKVAQKLAAKVATLKTENGI